MVGNGLCPTHQIRPGGGYVHLMAAGGKSGDCLGGEAIFNSDLESFEAPPARRIDHGLRSEEHTSELQSLMRISYAVFCLKKKMTNMPPLITKTHLYNFRLYS